MKILVKILSLLLLALVLVLPSFTEKKTSEMLCSGINVVITDSTDYQFVTRNDVLSLLNSRSDSVLGRKIEDISVEKLEKKISGLSEVKSVEAFFDINGTLNVLVNQRVPIMRIQPDNGGVYLMDRDGVVFKKTSQYVPRLHFVGGNINIKPKMLEGMSVLDTAMGNTILRDVYDIVNYVNNDKFWSAQIDQIYVTGQKKIELVPRMGNHVVKIGTSENFEKKMHNLELFYSQVMPNVGWDKYSEINLEYEGQVVCKRRE